MWLCRLRNKQQLSEPVHAAVLWYSSTTPLSIAPLTMWALHIHTVPTMIELIFLDFFFSLLWSCCYCIFSIFCCSAHQRYCSTYYTHPQKNLQPACTSVEPASLKAAQCDESEICADQVLWNCDDDGQWHFCSGILNFAASRLIFTTETSIFAAWTRERRGECCDLIHSASNISTVANQVFTKGFSIESQTESSVMLLIVII